MSEEEKKRLEAQLWKIANELRGKMDADEFRDYILGFIFYKYLSEKQQIFANKLLETEEVKDYAALTDGQDIAAIREESLETLGYFLRPNELFTVIAERGNADTKGKDNFILEDLETILNAIERSTMGTESEEDFNKLFEDIDLASTKLGRTVEARNTLIAKVLAHLDEINFKLETGNADVLGDAYEYLIGQFASGAGKKAGEFYTPQQVSRILAKIVTLDKKKIKSAYDPACGSGSLLLRIAKEADVGAFYGQELNRTTYNLARMNMILHDVHFSRFDIQQEDTLEEPQHLDMRFEAVVANPPFSAKWKGKNNPLNETDDRFSQYGAIAPSSKADFAFLQHMLYQLADNGTAAIVLPPGALYRGNSEQTIRKYLINDLNFLDAVIGLPPNLFYGTSIPACIIVLKKCRIHDDNIFFIDASADFLKLGNKNGLADEHVNRILDAVAKRESSDRYSYVAPIKEVGENDYNLNITRYIDPFEDIPRVNLEKAASFLNASINEIHQLDQRLTAYCAELGLPTPLGYNVPALISFRLGCMQKLFSKAIRFKDNQGNEFQNWKKREIKSLYSWVRTNSLARDRLTHEVRNIQNIHYGDIHSKFGSHLRQSEIDIPFIADDQADIQLRDSDFCRVGDVVIADASEDYLDVGKALEIVELSDTPLVAGLHTYIARPKKDKELALGFSGYLWQSENLRRRIMRIAQGVSVLGLPKPSLGKLTVEVPEFDEQQKITVFLSIIDRKISLIQRQGYK